MIAHFHTCLFTYLHTCTFVHFHIYTLSHLHTCTFSHLHICILAYLPTCIHSNLHTCILSNLHTFTFAYLQFCTFAYLHICTIAHLHTCTQAYLFACMRILHLILYLQIFYVSTLRELKNAKTFTGDRSTYRPTNQKIGSQKTSTRARNVQVHVKHFDSCFLISEMLENPRKWSLGRADRPTGLQKILPNETENEEK